MQNIVVIGRIYLKLERSEFSSNFEFDRNMLSGTGARTGLLYTLNITHCDLVDIFFIIMLLIMRKLYARYYVLLIKFQYSCRSHKGEVSEVSDNYQDL